MKFKVFLVSVFSIFSLFMGILFDGSVEALSPLGLTQIKYWAYQIQSLEEPQAISTLANSKYDMLVIDPTVTHDFTFNAKRTVSILKSSRASDGIHRKLVLAYIDIGQAEEWRWYWNGRPTYEQFGECRDAYIKSIQKWAPWVVACDPDGWAGNYPVAFWASEWKDIVIHGTDLGSDLGLYFNSMLDEVIQDGFDGVYLDWVEAWEMEAVRKRAVQDGIQPALSMVKFIRDIKEYGRYHNPQFIVIQQNSSDLINNVPIDSLSDAVDGIAQEGVWWDGEAVEDWEDPDGYDMASGLAQYYLPRLRKYLHFGFPVFVCDYAVTKSNDVYKKAQSEKFIAYSTRRPLSRLTSTPPKFLDIKRSITPILPLLLIDD